jgi:hypothetical protein
LVKDSFEFASHASQTITTTGIGVINTSAIRIQVACGAPRRGPVV